MATAEKTGFCQSFPVQPPTSFTFDKVSEWPALSEEQSRDYEVVNERFDAYFAATRNLVYERKERKKWYNNNNMIFTAVRTTKQPALRSTQFIEKLAGGQSTNVSTKKSESVWRVAEPVIGSHRVLQKEQSATGANDGDTSLRCARKGRTSRMPKQVHPR
ncbi:hypothetical protein MRX96_004521 [Rhipicephalus microplus]